MKKFFFLLVLIFLSGEALAQKQYLKISSENISEQKQIDSIGYNPKLENQKSLVDEFNHFNKKLQSIGYIESEVIAQEKINDSTHTYKVKLGILVKQSHLYIGNDSPLKKLDIIDPKTDTIKIAYSETENYLQQTLNQLEKKGWALSQIKLTKLKRREQKLYAELEVKTETERHFDDIVIKGEVNFPASHLKQLKRIYRKRAFTQQNLKNLASEIDKFRFIRQTKYPEILFKPDSTKIYCYLEKARANNFEGFVGFTNSETKKLTVNGYLDLTLTNLLKSGETFSVYWKSDGKDQKTFNANINLPYIFKSPLGIKAQLNIFKQDSTFQNTKTNLDLGYFFNYNTRLYLGYQSAESSDIQNQNTTLLNDFSNHFVTSEFEFTDWRPDNFLFSEKTKINFKIGSGSRTSKLNQDQQFFGQLNAKHIIFLNQKNNICIKTENFFLNSNHYITNELYRFGGINSIRGFNENSLQANLFSSIMTEYRFVPATSLYIYSIVDYGYYQDKTINKNGNLLGLGIGLGVITKNGLINLIYANGSAQTSEIKSANSIVHISFKTIF
ncbi:MAG: hypothetical protein JST78_03800 [Bacteroidetes bacterium]|nr:hypothetical protein [Bacteroidota bacterium]